MRHTRTEVPLDRMSELEKWELSRYVLKKPTMLYLATPISTKNPTELWGRYEDAARVLARLMTAGFQSYCPITHWLTAGIQYPLPREWSFWRRISFESLRRCDALVVLRLDGWRESQGVKAEIKEAKRLGLPIFYLPHSGDPRQATRG